MGDDITIGVTEIVNTIEVTAQPNDQIVDISVIDNADNVTLNITPTVIEINVNKEIVVEWGDIVGTLSNQTDLQGALNLKADLVGGKVPESQLPSYVDGIVEVANYAALPATGETGIIYVTLDNNKIYRWSGSIYIEIASSSAVWGAITGTLSSQTDLQNALNAKFNNPTGDSTQYIAGDGSLITFPIAGQSGTLVREIRNTTGATLTKGTVVYINGANGNKPTVAKAIATGDSTSAQTFGIIQADLANNSNGYAVCVGDIVGIDTSAIIEGTQLYLSSTTAGTYTTTKQLAPAHLVYIGIVTRSHPTLGQIEVKIQNGYELDEIHDVAISSKTNNQFLVYESATDLWKNKSLATVLGGTSSQFVKGNGTLDSNTYALTSQLHDAVTIGTANGLSLSTQVLSLGLASASANGALSSANWTTFNNKQNALSGTGFVKISGTTISYDSNTYLTSAVTSVAALTIGTTGTNITSTVANGTTTPVITLNIPTASATNRGALSSTDWTTFNNKLTLPSLTSGSVLFSNGTTIAQDNANFFWDDTNNRLGIGKTNPSTAIDVVGAITASGGFFNSDIRLKDLTDYDYNVSDIKPITYFWKDGRDDKKHVGYSAQEVQKVMPDAVNEGTDGMLSVNYVEVLVAKIAELENRIKQLEK